MRPSLAARIGNIAGLWSKLEVHRANLLAVALQMEANIATAMFVKIESDGGKQAVLRAAFEEKVPALLNDFLALNKRISGTYRERCDVLHGLWAVPKGPLARNDTLIWSDPRGAVASFGAMVTDTVSMIEKEHGAYTPIAWHKVTKYTEDSLEYTEQDFIDIENRIKERIREIDDFREKLKTEVRAR